jgi:hypothetical protein
VPHVEAPRPDTPHADDLSPRVVPTWDRRAATVNRPCRTDTVRNMHFKARGPERTPIVDRRGTHTDKTPLLRAPSKGCKRHSNAWRVERSPRHLR